MRILRIELKNLNSLYGEHTVDLAGELGEVPLFLIRGPTGAGKSTIMDAVALSLFGVTPRLPRGVGKSDEDPRLIMSRGEWQAAARVEVILGQVGAEQRYRATWECNRARKKADGNLQSPKRVLERWDATVGDWELLVSSAKEKEWKDPFNEALENLTVKDFQRMILLAQGEFAAFLKAGEDERGAIMERLTDTDQFKKVGQRVNRRRQQAWGRLEKISAELKGLELLSPEEEAQVKADLAVAQAEEAARLKVFKRARRWADWRAEQARLKKLAGDAEGKLPGLEERRIELEVLLTTLTASEKDARATLEAARDALGEKEPEIKEARRLKERLAGAAKELTRTEKEQKTAAVLVETRARAAEGLEETDLTPEQIQARRQELRQAGLALGEAARLVAEQARLAGEVTADEEKIRKAGERLTDATTRLKELEQVGEAAREAERSTGVKLEAVGWIRKLASERERLEEGEPCPLCGSTEHPLMGEGEQEEVERTWRELQREQAEQEAASKKREGAAGALKEGRAADNRELDTARDSLSKAKAALDRIPAELAQHLTVLTPELAGELTLRKEAHRSAQDELDILDRAARAYRELASAREALSKLERNLAERGEEVATIREQAAKVLGGQDPDQVEAALKGKISAAERVWAELDGELKRTGVELAKVKSRMEELGAQLVQLKEELTRAWERLGEDLAQLGNADPDDLRAAYPDETLRDQVLELEEQARTLSKLTGELRGKLEEQSRRRKKSEDLARKKDEAEQRHQVWLRLHKLVGERNGDAFRRFAQTLNLAELVGKANAHLIRLSDRYRLMAARDADGEPLLAFQVRDLYQAGEPRGLTTLSGGETFLISLALALALADYGSARMPVETLLLDEGFGTLDRETLQVAMNALRSLNAQGTQVGIISHVEALHEAIPACVEVKKLGGGRSSVEVKPEG